ncbi:MAG: response regulator [Rhizobacter sp.]
MDTFSLVTLAVVLLLVALVVWLWRKSDKSAGDRPSASASDEASAPEGAFGTVVPEPGHARQTNDTQSTDTQPADFADTETGGPDTEQNTRPPELSEEETQDLLQRLHQAAALDVQESERKQAELRAKEEAARQAALARALLDKKVAEENAAKLKALHDRALLVQAQAAAAAQAEQQAAKERQAAQAAREKALLEKLRAERLERERLQLEKVEREQAQARQKQAERAARQAEIERKTQEAQDLVEAAQKQQLLEAKERQKKEEEDANARAAAERAIIAAQPPRPAAVQHSRRAADIVVMVADDSKVVRIKASRLLAKYQYQVLLAEDGADAAAQLQSTLPDILITDVEMPGMDGFELTRHVRSNARTAHIPVIMITAADDRYQVAAKEAGVNVLLGKPFEDEDLIARIRSTLRPA